MIHFHHCHWYRRQEHQLWLISHVSGARVTSDYCEVATCGDLSELTRGVTTLVGCADGG